MKLHGHVSMVFLNDKHRVKVGEPGLPVASVERGKKVLVSLNNTFQVCDHDFISFSLIPSVTLLIDVPDKIDGSWYHGVVTRLMSYYNVSANYGSSVIVDSLK